MISVVRSYISMTLLKNKVWGINWGGEMQVNTEGEIRDRETVRKREGSRVIAVFSNIYNKKARSSQASCAIGSASELQHQSIILAFTRHTVSRSSTRNAELQKGHVMETVTHI